MYLYNYGIDIFNLGGFKMLNQKLNDDSYFANHFVNDYHLDRIEVEQICSDHGVSFSDLLKDIGSFKNYSHNEIFTWLGY